MKRESIEEKFFRTKYLYLIDAQKVAEEIKNSDAFKAYKEDSKTLPQLLRYIFSEIMKASARYTDFINPRILDNSFFGFNFNLDKQCSDKRKFLATLCQESLFNHCILNAYFYSLSFQNNMEMIPLQQVITPYVANIDSKDQVKYNRQKRHQGNSAKGYYSNMLLDSFFPSFIKDGGVPACCKEWFDFLYIDTAVMCFNKSLTSKEKRVFPTYQKLFLACKSTRDFVKDKLAFDAALEKIYGFNYFSYFNNIAHVVSQEKLSKTEQLKKDLLIPTFYQIAAEINNNRMCYNRSIFIEYAIEVIAHCDSLNEGFLYHIDGLAFTQLRQLGEVDNELPEALMLIRYYIKTLNIIAIPLLESLWLSVIHFLTDNDINLEDTLNNGIYRDYIEKHAEQMQTEYSTSYTNKNLDDFAQSDFNWEKFVLPQNLCNIVEPSYLKTKLSNYQKEIIADMLKPFCLSMRHNSFEEQFDRFIQNPSADFANGNLYNLYSLARASKEDDLWSRNSSLPHN